MSKNAILPAKITNAYCFLYFNAAQSYREHNERNKAVNMINIIVYQYY